MKIHRVFFRLVDSACLYDNIRSIKLVSRPLKIIKIEKIKRKMKFSAIIAIFGTMASAQLYDYDQAGKFTPFLCS